MERVILIRFGEIFLKGKNRGYFEKSLFSNIKTSLEKFNLDKPEIYKYVEELNNLGLKLDINNIKDVDDLIKEIKDGHYR